MAGHPWHGAAASGRLTRTGAPAGRWDQPDRNRRTKSTSDTKRDPKQQHPGPDPGAGGRGHGGGAPGPRPMTRGPGRGRGEGAPRGGSGGVAPPGTGHFSPGGRAAARPGAPSRGSDAEGKGPHRGRATARGPRAGQGAAPGRTPRTPAGRGWGPGHGEGAPGPGSPGAARETPRGARAYRIMLNRKPVAFYLHIMPGMQGYGGTDRAAVGPDQPRQTAGGCRGPTRPRGPGRDGTRTG